MIGMMIMTFILFFAFVVNTGMLVNAKINLQNAADLAAYSGAATQARLLNQISFLNYEMRRQYKKFLFRYYVMGNMAQKSFPRGTPGVGKLWTASGTDPDYQAPVVCMIFNASDNFCQLNELPKIAIPAPSVPGLDAINETLVTQLQQIEKIRTKNCETIGVVNTITLRLWLFNTDPGLTNLANNAGLAGDQQKAIGTIAGLAQGLGIIPRELLLRQRIKTLNGYVNAPGRQNVTLGSLGGLQGGPEPEKDERTINAFLSAYYTLGNHTFAAGDVAMDELVPDALLVLKDITAHFDTVAVDFTFDAAATDGSPCKPELVLDKAGPFPVGVSKDRNTLTYYAVKLRAKAKVMFSPFGTMELKAYAAAQPFGSRIGPAIDEGQFVDLNGSANNSLLQRGGRIGVVQANGIPNLPIRPGEGVSAGQGWNNVSTLSTMYTQFSGNAAASTGDIDLVAINRALRAAMVPNPIEVNLYNIMTDQAFDSFNTYFGDGGMATIWAPLFPLSGAQGDLQSEIRGMIDPGNKLGPTLTNAIAQGMTQYVAQLRQGAGENREGFNYVRLENPFLGTDGQPIRIPNISASPSDVKTSWANALNKEYRDQGRIGYSVKFVSFDSLYQNRQSTDGETNWNNTLKLDSEASADLPFLKH